MGNLVPGGVADVITLFYKLWPKVANRGMVYSIDELKELGVVGIDHPTFEDDVELCEKNYSYKKPELLIEPWLVMA